MYYRTVNRGISFTKSGRYAVMFVFGIGMVAVNTGANGMFLFLSLGLALIVVSGLLSESTVQHGTVKQFSSQTITAESPFKLTIYVVNNHRHVSLYGLEFEIHQTAPNLRFLRQTTSSIGTGSILTLGPDMTKPSVCECTGVSRGQYKSLNLLLKTNFPFGFITKFKTTKITGSLVAAPKVDEDLIQILGSEFGIESSQANEDVEFHSHTPFESAMNSKHIDWKKSAGRPPSLWVVKEYRAQATDFSLLVKTDWLAISNSEDEREYEGHLVAIRTAIALAERASRSCHLQLANESNISNADQIVTYLACLPQFHQRKEISKVQIEGLKASHEIKGAPVVLFITGSGHQWRSRHAPA